jgi:signal transduction histidine kinase
LLWFLAVMVTGVVNRGVTSPEASLIWFRQADVLARYFLAIPGSLLAAAGLMAQQHDFRQRGMPTFGRDLVWAATALLIYGVVGQIFVRATPLFPSSVINAELFLQWFGVPIQLLRAAAAIVLLVFMMRALRASEEESRRRLEEAARSEVEARERLLAAERAAGQERDALNRLLGARARELSLLLDLSNLLSGRQSLPERLESALARVVEDITFCDAALILLDDAINAEPHVAASIGYRSEDVDDPATRYGPSVALGRHVCANATAACTHADGITISFNIGVVLRGRECLRHPTPTLLIALPLAARSSPGDSRAVRSAPAEETIGSIVFARDRAFTDALSIDELHLMMGIAQQIEHSLETSRLYEEAQAREQTLGHLLRQVVEAQESERRRIARELHDATGQSLSAIAMGMRGLANAVALLPRATLDPAALEADPPDLSAPLPLVEETPAAFAPVLKQSESLQAFATDALRELRRIIEDLRPPQLDDLGLAAALRWYVQSLSQRHPAIRFSFTAGAEPSLLPAHYETVIFRVAQEALTNIVRHSGASNAWMRLEAGPGEVLLEVEDDGVGFDTARMLSGRSETPSWGLLGMRERALLLGGQYEVTSTPGEGTRVRLCVPRPVAKAAPRSRVDDGA